jgi:hypothetical protein
MAGGLAALSQLGPMIQKAIAEGDVQIEQGGSQTIDMRGTGLREEILGIMEQHGIDPETGTAQNVDANAYGACSSRSSRRSRATASTPAPPGPPSTFSSSRRTNSDRGPRAPGPQLRPPRPGRAVGRVPWRCHDAAPRRYAAPR